MLDVFNSAVQGIANGIIIGGAFVWLCGLPERRQLRREREAQRELATAISRAQYAHQYGEPQPLDVGQAEARRRGQVQ